MRLPWALPVAVAVGLAGWWLVSPDRSARPAPASPEAAAWRDSLVAALTIDSLRLLAWADSVVALRGDSLRAAAGRRAAVVRPRLPAVIQRDTVRDTVTVPGADLRALLVSDSACRVRCDSLEAALLVESSQRPEVVERRDWRTLLAVGAVAVAVGLAVGVGVR